MKKAEYYGLDISSLKPGDIITRDTLKDLYDKNVHIKEDGKTRAIQFPFFLMRLRKDIQETLFGIGKFARVVQRRNDLHIIQGDAMSRYTFNQISKALGKVVVEYEIASLVDKSSMDDEQVKRHDRSLLVTGEHINAMREVRDKHAMNEGKLKSSLRLISTKDKKEWGF